MRIRQATCVALGLICLLATSCTIPITPAAPTEMLLMPTLTLPAPSATTAPSPTALLVPTLPAVAPDPVAGGSQSQGSVTRVVSTQVPPEVFCADAQATALLDNFKSALHSGNGAALATLISPTHGMDARLYRDGRIVNYDQAHAKFLFDSTYSVDWGAAPGSGQHTNGSFHQVVIPDLLDVFNKAYTLSCDQVQVGGASYPTTWPYPGINYYSVYYPGTTANGNMDWHTWLIGMQYLNNRPYLYAIMQFKWEP